MNLTALELCIWFSHLSKNEHKQCRGERHSSAHSACIFFLCVWRMNKRSADMSLSKVEVTEVDKIWCFLSAAFCFHVKSPWLNGSIINNVFYIKLLSHWRNKASLCSLIDPINIILSHVIRGLQNLSKEMTWTWSHDISLNYSNDSIKYYDGSNSQQQQ